MRRHVALAGAVVVLLAAAAPAVGAGPLEDARDAAETTSFTGVVRIEWKDDGARRVERAHVRSSNGAMVIDGSERLVAGVKGRFVYQRGVGWELMWSNSLPRDDRPPPWDKYELEREPSWLSVAGRSTQRVEVRRDGRLWERLYVDAATGLVLRRVQYDRDGGVRRIVTFEELETTARTTPVSVPADATDQTPEWVPGSTLSAPYRAPERLGSGYRLLGAYERDRTVHLVYSDGVYDLSVFEQRGRLRGSDVPEERTEVSIGDERGWRVPWAGGEVVMWQADGAVYTVVGEAPLADILEAARSMPSAGRPSLVDRLRRACQALFDAL